MLSKKYQPENNYKAGAKTTSKMCLFYIGGTYSPIHQSPIDISQGSPREGQVKLASRRYMKPYVHVILRHSLSLFVMVKKSSRKEELIEVANVVVIMIVTKYTKSNCKQNELCP